MEQSQLQKKRVKVVGAKRERERRRALMTRTAWNSSFANLTRASRASSSAFWKSQSARAVVPARVGGQGRLGRGCAAKVSSRATLAAVVAFWSSSLSRVLFPHRLETPPPPPHRGDQGFPTHHHALMKIALPPPPTHPPRQIDLFFPFHRIERSITPLRPWPSRVSFSMARVTPSPR
eukprot:scaffold7976_cov105-Isochrysis_galbana.AAC.2